MIYMRNTNELAAASVKRLIQLTGNQRVSAGAVNGLREYLENRAMNISETAQKLARHAGRKTVTDLDIRMAIDELEKKSITPP
ncbi:histone [Candidatus Fermentibacteria bacterium]|nr:MAG: histone [Candidatus Fermentibacteria bacterium]